MRSWASWHSPWHILGHTVWVKTHLGLSPTRIPGHVAHPGMQQECTVQSRHTLPHTPGVHGTAQGAPGATEEDTTHP